MLLNSRAEYTFIKKVINKLLNLKKIVCKRLLGVKLVHDSVIVRNVSV